MLLELKCNAFSCILGDSYVAHCRCRNSCIRNLRPNDKEFQERNVHTFGFTGWNKNHLRVSLNNLVSLKWSKPNESYWYSHTRPCFGLFAKFEQSLMNTKVMTMIFLKHQLLTVTPSLSSTSKLIFNVNISYLPILNVHYKNLTPWGNAESIFKALRWDAQHWVTDYKKKEAQNERERPRREKDDRF